MTRPLALAAAILLAAPEVCGAFYELDSGGSALETRMLVRVSQFVNRNPDIPLLYANGLDGGADISARLIAEGKAFSNLKFDFHAVQYTSSTSIPAAITPGTSSSVGRSPALTISERDDGFSKQALDIDRASVNAEWGAVDVTVGRQPISLATCYYFTPNDFFAPFSAAAFYRVYKPGVDAARLEARLGALTQFTAAGVAGYKRRLGGTGFADDVDWGDSSYVAKLAVNAGGFGLGVMGGRIRRNGVAGGSFQGEIGKLGIRGEGHYEFPARGSTPIGKAAAQVERKYESSLTARGEYFYNGAGASNAKDYAPFALYPAMQYAAFGLDYEFSPLLTGSALAVVNLVDGSYAPYFNFVYSLSNEAELSLGFSAPAGALPSGMETGSEFGKYPASFNAEIRAYF